MLLRQGRKGGDLNSPCDMKGGKDNLFWENGMRKKKSKRVRGKKRGHNSV